MLAHDLGQLDEKLELAVVALSLKVGFDSEREHGLGDGTRKARAGSSIRCRGTRARQLRKHDGKTSVKQCSADSRIIGEVILQRNSFKPRKLLFLWVRLRENGPTAPFCYETRETSFLESLELVDGKRSINDVLAYAA